MTSIETTTTDPAPVEREAYDTDTFGIGEACGVCIFPTGPGQICGNVVYANQAKGRLPKYCGQEGQEHWQAQHGTEGNKRHKSDLAGYPRRTLGMTPEDVQALADAEAARRGIGRRLKSETASAATNPAVAAPVADAAAAPAAPVLDLADALPESAVDALAELARLIAGRVVATRAEMDAIRADAEARVAEVEREGAQRAEALDAERAGLESDRAEAQAARDRAEDEIRQAREARLTTEGQLTEAKARIAELERALSDAEARHRAEIAEVRRTSEERYDKLVAAFAATRTEPVRDVPAAQPRRKAAPPITADVLENMAGRVHRGEVIQVGGQRWRIASADATTPAAATLDHMNAAGFLDFGPGDPAVVMLSPAWAKRTPDQPPE
ncbi:hypothetical protein ACWDUN_29860 [Mycobacterium sp. NPDC003323]